MPRLSASARGIAHVVALHGVLGLLAWIALRQQPGWLLVAEAFLVLSLAAGIGLMRQLAAPAQMLATGTELLREGDFTSRFRETGSPELDALAGTYNAMADRLRAERARLVEQDLFLERLVDASPAGVVTLDLDGRVSLVSPSAERLLGVRSASVVGAEPSALGRSGPSLASISDGESRLLDLDRRTLRVRRARFHDRGFARSFFLVEEMTEELRASEREARDRVVQVMAHEVRNTVGAVGSLLDSLSVTTRRLSGEERADFEAALSIASRRLLGLNAFMNAVADVVRMPDPVLAPCDANALLRDACTLMTPRAEERGVRLTWSPEIEATASFDKNQIEQVLLNGMQNAIDASPRGGTIEVALIAGESGPIVRIRDEGAGLSPEALRSIGRPFFTTRPGGRGVGLMLVREVLSRHRFAHALENRPGGGAELRIHLHC